MRASPGRSGGNTLVRPRGRDLFILRVVLCRAGLVDPGCWERLHRCLATLGEIVAWVIGWDLILEYGVSLAAIGVSWGAKPECLPRKRRWDSPTGEVDDPLPDGGFNLPAVVIVLAITFLLIRGVKETATLNEHYGGHQARGAR